MAVGFIRVMLLLAMSCFSWSALADGPKCVPFGASASGFKITLAPTADFTQWAADPSAYYITSWWCVGKYAPTGFFYFGARTDLPSNWMSEVQKVPSASLDALIAAQSQYMTKSLSPEALAAGQAQLAATKPALPVWVVPKNYDYPTRPMYRVQNGLRATTALKSPRAAVGAVCSCDRFVIEEGTLSFCPLAASLPELDKITRCVPLSTQ